MLFNSYIFIYMFLPVALIGYWVATAYFDRRIALGWLVLCSLFFYSWWLPFYLVLILTSIGANFLFGVYLGGVNRSQSEKKTALIVGVTLNLALIGYYKYANFFVDTVNIVGGAEFHLQTIILPLAISFFTFQQIAYLVDAYKGETREYSILHYCLFVTFFPQLIAGPIVHHKEMLPQFEQRQSASRIWDNIAIGLSIFMMGLFKKVMLADSVAPYSDLVFFAAEQGATLTFAEAWAGSLAYTFQIYFDFSGYSDMAIGLARMFGVNLPLNFYSPYKANNIIDFWRRWHMTLSRFLRDYLYIPLGGNRQGPSRRHVNLMTTMLLGGLWHGAGWTFVAWGLLHGFYLIVNHAWHGVRRKLGHDLRQTTRLGTAMSRLLMLLCVIVSWVFFRAESFGGAMRILEGMSGVNGFAFPVALRPHLEGVAELLVSVGIEVKFISLFPVIPMPAVGVVAWLVGLSLVALFAPNVRDMFRQSTPEAADVEPSMRPQSSGARAVSWSISLPWAAALFVVSVLALQAISPKNAFLYFQF